jgi:hypothetical protein
VTATTANRLYWLLGGPGRLRTNLNGMRTTLERIKAVVEQEQEQGRGAQAGGQG